MRIPGFAIGATIALICAFPANATPVGIGDGHVGGQPPASHPPAPVGDLRRYEPPDPCRKFHTQRSHAGCTAGRQSHTMYLENGRMK